MATPAGPGAIHCCPKHTEQGGWQLNNNKDNDDGNGDDGGGDDGDGDDGGGWREGMTKS